MSKLLLTSLFFASGLFCVGAHASQSWDSVWKSLIADDATSWEDQSGKPLHLSGFGDRRVVVTMAYSQCKKICPMMTMTKLKEMQASFDQKKIDADFYFFQKC